MLQQESKDHRQGAASRRGLKSAGPLTVPHLIAAELSSKWESETYNGPIFPRERMGVPPFLVASFLQRLTVHNLSSARVHLGPARSKADHWVEMQGSTTSNEAAVCLAVDGVFDNNCGFLEDKIPPDSSWLQVTSSHSMSGVPVGTHTVQTYAESSNGTNVAYFNINYRVILL
jgi:hypothetical protein